MLRRSDPTPQWSALAGVVGWTLAVCTRAILSKRAIMFLPIAAILEGRTRIKSVWVDTVVSEEMRYTHIIHPCLCLPFLVFCFRGTGGGYFAVPNCAVRIQLPVYPSDGK